LALCSAVIAPVEGDPKGLGEDNVLFEDVPRQNWRDRVSIEFKPLGGGRIAVHPYPFRTSSLTLSVPSRVVEPHADWRQASWTLKQFTFLRS